MTTRMLALILLLSGGLGASAQENGGFIWIRFHRVQLRNGNCIEGALVSKTEQAVTLKLPTGEMTIRTDQIDRVEFVKIKSWNEPVLVLAKKAPPVVNAVAPAVASDRPARPVAAAHEGLTDSQDAVPPALANQLSAAVDQAIGLWRSPAGKVQDLGETLVALGPDTVPYLEFLLEKRMRSTPLSPVAAALATLAEDRFTDLSARMMSAQYGELRTAAVIGLSKTTSPRRIPILMKALDDPDPSVWKAALDTVLAATREEGDKRDLIDTLSARIRTSGNKVPLATGLARMGGRDAHDALWDLVEDADESTRQIGLHALGVLASPDDGPRVVALLRDPSITIRKAACLTIAKLKYTRATATLVDLLDDENEALQKNARYALSQVTGQGVPDKTEAWKAWWTNFGLKDSRFSP